MILPSASRISAHKIERHPNHRIFSNANIGFGFLVSLVVMVYHSCLSMKILKINLFNSKDRFVKARCYGYWFFTARRN
jgi:hypothetical protein